MHIDQTLIQVTSAWKNKKVIKHNHLPLKSFHIEIEFIKIKII